MIKYFVIALIAVTESSGTFNALRGYLKDLPYPLAAAAVIDRQGTAKTQAQKPVSEPVAVVAPSVKIESPKPVKSHDLTDEEIINLFIRNAH